MFFIIYFINPLNFISNIRVFKIIFCKTLSAILKFIISPLINIIFFYIIHIIKKKEILKEKIKLIPYFIHLNFIKILLN